MEFIFVSDILTEIRSYHKTTEQHLRETIFASTPDYIELTSDYPYYYLGIRAVDIISDSFYFDYPYLYRFYVDIRFFNFFIFNNYDLILKVIIVSNELDLKEVSSTDKFDIYSLIDLSSVTFKSHCSPTFSLEGYETLLDSSLSCFIFEGEGVRDDTISFKHIIYKDNNDSVVALSDFLKSILLFRDSFIYLNNLDLTKDKFSVSISLSLVYFSYYESAQYLKDFFLELDDFLESIDKRFNLLFDIDIYFSDNDKHSRNLVLLNRPLRHPIYKFLNTYRKKGCSLINYSFHTYGRRLL